MENLKAKKCSGVTFDMTKRENFIYEESHSDATDKFKEMDLQSHNGFEQNDSGFNEEHHTAPNGKLVLRYT